MYFEPYTVPLKDGRTAVFRAPAEADAAGTLDYLRAACAETDFLLRSLEECEQMTVEDEARWLMNNLHDPDTLLIVCEVDGEIAGNCEISFNHRTKVKHQASIGIGLKKKFWGLGIGTAMFQAMEAEARRRPDVLYMKLEFIEGNSRARALYEKMGFRVVGVVPAAFVLPGGLANEYLMQKWL